jgi:hypothetical protein
MARKSRSPEKGRPADIDVVGLYDELAPSWKLGSADTKVPVWSRAIFGGRRHHPAGWQLSADGNIILSPEP